MSEALKMSPHERRSRIVELKARAIEGAADAVGECPAQVIFV